MARFDILLKGCLYVIVILVSMITIQHFILFIVKRNMNKMKKEIKVEVKNDFTICDNTGKLLQEFKEGEQFDVKLNKNTWKFICGELVVAEYNYFGNIKMHDGFKLI
ncbi:hypothetical protein [Bacillus thuringiensis]|nr:hypothetical protein [Bacillus thuringiensis]